MKWLTTPLKFLVNALGNLIADAAQIEAAVPTVTGILSGIFLVNGSGGAAGHIGSAIGIAGSSLALALPKIVTVGKQVETDFELLLTKATGGTGGSLTTILAALETQVKVAEAAGPGTLADVKSGIEAILLALEGHAAPAAPVPMHPPVVPPAS